MSEYYIGLLSGTSMDGIDAALVDFACRPPKLITTHSEPISPELKANLRLLCVPGHDEINRLGQMDVILGRLFAKAVNTLLSKSSILKNHIKAIGSHGQTIRHHPHGDTPFSLQIGDANIIAANTGISTITDFRRTDIAYNGQGAPLAPAFHEYLFRNQQHDCFAVNIGGIANLTYLPKEPEQKIVGFDVGPGNTLMDHWIHEKLNKPYDENGEWADSGTVNQDLLNALLADEYFEKTPPKSTGPEYFNLAWVLQKYSGQELKAADIQRTLLELTAQTIANDIHRSLYLIPYSNPEARPSFSSDTPVYLCGGGASNKLLVHRLQTLLPDFKVLKTDDVDIPSQWLEAMLFAWLAKQRLEKQPGNVPSVTGSEKEAVLGNVYA